LLKMKLKINSLLFGTAGIPIAANPRTTPNGISKVKELGLGAMELEFVHSVNITKEKAPEINEIAKKNNVVLTCHAPYYINLNAVEKPKWHASISRIVQSAKITSLCGGYSVCFHPAYYLKQDPKDVFSKVKEAISIIVEELKNSGVEIWVRPETAGRVAQFGNLSEILDMCAHFDNVLPCIDWSHLHAQSNGKYNTKKEFEDVLSLMENKLGKRAMQNVHFHCQGVAYSDKGEKSHIPLKESDLNYTELVRAWKEFGIKGVVISESPNIEKDALLMKRIYDSA